MELRPYADTDWKTCARWFPEDDPFMDRMWLDAAVRGARHRPESHFLCVGIQDGELVSIVSLSRLPTEDRAIVSLLVAPTKRSKGAARATFQAVRDKFSDIDEITAYVDSENAASLGLMESLGLQRAPRDDEADRERFVWRRDGRPIADDWQPPSVPWR